MTAHRHHPAWIFILFPAVAMLLGWGLRGYIGGGPYGALIPGSFVALSLALLLGYRMETAAMAALFGAIGVGYGGNMTYGQTLGFLRETDTIYWGVLGCLVKGSIWGLLGGAVLGVGLSRDHYARKVVIGAFILMVPAYLFGVYLINEPKFIYFSDRLNEPRDESWAGLLFAAIALLAWLYRAGTKRAFEIPIRFALWGALGGGAGFGGGCLWLAFGEYIPVNQQVIGWWKMMEFSFGFLFGGALGWCAWLNREHLRHAGQAGETPAANWGPAAGLIAYVVAVFGGYILLGRILHENFNDSGTFPAAVGQISISLLFGYVLLATVTIILGLHSLHAAWQAAVTLTVFHTVLDYTRDLDDADKFGYALGGGTQLIIVLLASALVGVLAWRFMRGTHAVQREFLLVLWACYLVACVRSFAYAGLLFPPEGQSGLAFLLEKHPTLIFVHGTFTISAIITTWFIIGSGQNARGLR